MIFQILRPKKIWLQDKHKWGNILLYWTLMPKKNVDLTVLLFMLCSFTVPCL